MLHIANRKACGEHMVVESIGLQLLSQLDCSCCQRNPSYLGASSDGRVIYTNIETCCVSCLEMECPYSIEGNVTANPIRN